MSEIHAKCPGCGSATFKASRKDARLAHKWTCPKCGHATTVQKLLEKGAVDEANRAVKKLR